MTSAMQTHNAEQDKARLSGGKPPPGRPHCNAWAALLKTLNGMATETEKEVIRQHVDSCCGSPAMAGLAIIIITSLSNKSYNTNRLNTGIMEKKMDIGVICIYIYIYLLI